MSKPLSPEVKLGRENTRLKFDNANLRKELELYKRQSGGFMIDDAIDRLRDFLQTNPQAKWVFPKNKIDKLELRQGSPFSKTHWEGAAKTLSDWHLSEVVRPEETNGVNEYSSVICANRAYNDCLKTKRILQGHNSLYPIRFLWMQILGDMISGSIHDEQRFTNDLSDQSAVVLAAHLIQFYIEELLDLGLPIDIDCVVGNHPRTTVKMPTKRQAHLSYDYLIYEMVANYFRKNDQVTFHIHTGQTAIKEVLGWRYILEHGISVRNGQEENFEDQLRGVYDDPTYRGATGMQGPAFDQIVIGNMHKPKFLERTIVNGSLIGQNELGVGWHLKTIKAQQFMWGISEDHVRTWHYAVDSTDVRSKKADNPFSDYASWFMKRHGRF